MSSPMRDTPPASLANGAYDDKDEAGGAYFTEMELFAAARTRAEADAPASPRVTTLTATSPGRRAMQCAACHARSALTIGADPTDIRAIAISKKNVGAKIMTL